MKYIEITVKVKARFELRPVNYTGEFKDNGGNLIDEKVLEYELEAVKDDPYAFFESSNFDGEPEGKIVEEPAPEEHPVGAGSREDDRP